MAFLEDLDETTARRQLLWIAGLALLVRAAFLLLEPHTYPVGDERTWTDWAVRNLLSEKVGWSPLRTKMVFYPPLYPYFIAVPYALTGTLTAVKWTQIVVGALAVLGIGRATLVAYGPAAGVIAGLCAALYPELVWFSVHFWSETLFLAFLWWAIAWLLQADRAGTARTAALAGLLWGLAILTRETVLFLTPLIALGLAFRGRPGGRARGASFLIVALLTVAPWTYRNWLVFQSFVPVATAGGLNLFQGNARLTRQEVYDRYEAVQGRIEQYHFAMQEGLKAIRERQPLWAFEKLYDEMPNFWEADSLVLIHIKRGAYGDVLPGTACAIALLVLLPYLAVLAAFLLGLRRLPLDRASVFLLGFLLYYTAIHVATHGFARYRLPSLPVLFLVGAWWLASRARAAVPRHRDWLVAALAVGLAASLAPSIRKNLHHQAFGLLAPDETGSEEGR
jgi:hypothetical protein